MTTININDAVFIVCKFYSATSNLYKLLEQHSLLVAKKALELYVRSRIIHTKFDLQLILTGAFLHDIGIVKCHAPSILCKGASDYIAHGILGAEMLREYGKLHNMDLEAHARICERHTGTGITAQEVRLQNLPIPIKDYLPETLEEKLICLADKFFSKSGEMKEKSIQEVREAMAKFGPNSLARFDGLCALFNVRME